MMKMDLMKSTMKMISVQIFTTLPRSRHPTHHPYISDPLFNRNSYVSMSPVKSIDDHHPLHDSTEKTLDE